jgi:hypothetical protein
MVGGSAISVGESGCACEGVGVDVWAQAFRKNMINNRITSIFLIIIFLPSNSRQVGCSLVTNTPSRNKKAAHSPEA